MNIHVLNSRLYVSPRSNRKYQISQATKDMVIVTYFEDIISSFAGDYADSEAEYDISRYEVKREYERLKRVYESLVKGDLASESEECDAILLVMAEAKERTVDEMVDDIKDAFPIDDSEYDLVAISISRERVVLETTTIYVAVKKGFGDDATTEAEHWIENSMCETSSLDWEVEDEEYEICGTEVLSSFILTTDSIEELNSAYEITDILE